MDYLFAFSTVHQNKPSYVAVRFDHSLFITSNKTEFETVTRLQPKPLTKYPYGYYYNNPDLEIKMHEDYTEAGKPLLFVVSYYYNKIIPINENTDICRYPNTLCGYNEIDLSYFSEHIMETKIVKHRGFDIVISQQNGAFNYYIAIRNGVIKNIASLPSFEAAKDEAILGLDHLSNMQVCKKCGSTEVARCKWVNVNNAAIYTADSGTTLEWCFTCKNETTIIYHEDYEHEK